MRRGSHMSTNTMMRDDETGQFRPTPRRQIVDDYLEDEYGVSLSELLAAYESVNDTLRGRLAFP